MKKRQISIPRLIVAGIGLILLILAFEVLKPEFLAMSLRGFFIEVTLILLYLIYTVPLIFTYDGRHTISGLFAGGAVYYRGAHVFAVISIALMVVSAVTLVPLRYVIVGELIAVFVFTIYSYAAVSAAAHVIQVKERDEVRVSSLDSLRKKTMELNSKASGLGMENEELKNRIRTLTENLRYLTPSGDAQALELERRMQDLVNHFLFMDLQGISGQEARALVMNQLKELENLYAMRKNIY